MTAAHDSSAEIASDIARVSSTWSPFGYRAFTVIWIATVVSNVGTWIQNAGAGWLMTSLNPDPVIVALVQVATSAPMFLFALPAGALADTIDRRRLLIVIEIVATAAVAVLAVMVSRNTTTDVLLLVLTFVIGVTSALGTPAWQAINSDLVPRAHLPPAIALNSIGFNVSRAIGPPLAGICIAAWGIAAPFWLNILDVRYAGAVHALDWDIEAMGQEGHLANERVRAWAFGSRSGYTFRDVLWSPRLGLQVDAASGDKNPHDSTLGTFNPLFPNGYYVTLAGYTGYVNFIHVKPSITLKPMPGLTAMFAVAAQWRETTADAVYTQPDIPVPGTAGRGGKYTGTYFQGRIDWQMTSHITSAVEAVRFNVAEAIRQAGGSDGTYLGVELKFGW